MPTMPKSESLQRARDARRLSKSVSGLLKHADAWWPATQTTKITALLEDMPVTSRKTYIKAMMGKSPAAAIKAHCMECVGWLRADVTNCTGVACALWPYRPFRRAAK